MYCIDASVIFEYNKNKVKNMRIINQTIYFLYKKLSQMGINLSDQNDSRLEAMKREIAKAGGKIEFKIEQYPDGSWTAQSINIDGIITGNRTTKNISATIKDAIFTYFGVPPYLCQDDLLKSDNEPTILKQKVYV